MLYIESRYSILSLDICQDGNCAWCWLSAAALLERGYDHSRREWSASGDSNQRWSADRNGFLCRCQGSLKMPMNHQSLLTYRSYELLLACLYLCWHWLKHRAIRQLFTHLSTRSSQRHLPNSHS